MRRYTTKHNPPGATFPSLLAWNNAAYQQHVRQLLEKHDTDTAMSLAVGGDWEETAPLLEGALNLAGLSEQGVLVDVGCGAGRLAERLLARFSGTYVGTDVVPDLIAYAASKCTRSSWRFELAQGTSIPMSDESTDMVCFFSVFTHLPHEAIYAYLKECHRVLRPGGVVVASFLEFADPALWPVFDGMITNLESATHLNQFTHREDIVVWCSHLGLTPERFIGATDVVIPISTPEDQKPQFRHFGQALCLLRKN